MNNPTDRPCQARSTFARRSPRRIRTGPIDTIIAFDKKVFKTTQTITLTRPPARAERHERDRDDRGPEGGRDGQRRRRSRVFQVDAGVTASISGLTISGGNAGKGGGLYNDGGNVTLTNCTVSGNSATFGWRRPGQLRHGHADQLHRQRQLRRRRRRRPVQLRRHDDADQLHRQRNSAANGGGLFNARHGHADRLHRQRQLRHTARAAGLFTRRHGHS